MRPASHKRRGKYDDHIVTDLSAPTTNIALLDDVIGETESDHLPIICVTNHPRLASRNKGPMRFDASRVPKGYRVLRDPAVWAESGDLVCAVDISRNACGSTGTDVVPRARYIGEAHCGDCQQQWTVRQADDWGTGRTSDLHDLRLIEAAWPLKTTKQQRRAPGRLRFKEKRRIKRLKAKHKIQRPMRLQALVMERQDAAKPCVCWRDG